MEKLFALGKLEFKTSLVYRLQFMSSIIISPLLLALAYFIWQAIYSNNPGSVLGYTFQDMMAYYVVMLVIGHFIYNTVGDKLQQKVLYGELTQDLLKPVPVFAQFFSRELAERSFAFLVEVIPVFIISLIFFNIRIYSIFTFIAFILGMAFAFTINFLLGYLTGLLAFWMKNIESIQWLMFFIIRFLSGDFLPLDFFGQSFLFLSRYMPFYYLRYGLAQVFLGKFTLQEILFFGLGQMLWVIFLYLLVRIIWGIALKKFGAVGG